MEESRTLIWKNEFDVEKTQYVRALGSHFVIIKRDDKKEESNTRKIGLYYVEIDFKDVENRNLGLTDYILEVGVKPIFEFTPDQFTNLTRWEAKGNDHILSISFVLELEPRSYTAKLMALTNRSGDFVMCNEIKETYMVNAIDLILPSDDEERAYVLYSTENGLDGGGRH
jgi:hypothetical protein